MSKAGKLSTNSIYRDACTRFIEIRDSGGQRKTVGTALGEVLGGESELWHYRRAVYKLECQLRELQG